MGSRKDFIKRSLGITEYPWSSDDDLEEAPLVAEDSSHHRPPGEPRPSTADAPGSSGLRPQQQQQQQQQQQLPQQQQMDQMQQHQQQQQLNEQQQQQHATARRNQARLDRDLFWSIINSPHRIPVPSSRPRSSEIPVSYVSRMNHVPAPELRERADRPAADIQRILAFKRLTRNLNSLRHRGHITGVIPVTRVNPGVIVPSEANSGIRINRHVPIRRFVRTGPYGPLPHETYARERLPPARLGGRSPRPPRGLVSPGAEPEQPPPPPSPQPPPPPPVLLQNLDEVNNNPIRLSDEIIVEEEENVEQDVPLEGEIENDVGSANSSPTVQLEEEIVAIDLDNSDAQAQIVAGDEEAAHETRAGTSVPTAAPGPSDTYQRTADDAPVASTSGTTSDAELTQQPSHGIKRKRRDSDDNIEPYSVKEFNQNLLRLLECPVCLEWMEPPMSQCRRGHLVCGRCRARLASCPVCRTTFSSVRNRAMEGVAEMLRYPCRHGCGREVRLRRRAPHEASCAARKYQCPAPLCADTQPLPRNQLAHHFQLSESLSSSSSSSSSESEGSSRQASPEPFVRGSVNTWPSVENDEEFLLAPEPIDLRCVGHITTQIIAALHRINRDVSPSMDAARIRPIHNGNEASRPVENDQVPLLPQNHQNNGQPLRHSYGARPYLRGPHGVLINLLNQPLRPVENISQRDSEQLLEHSYVASPHLGALHGVPSNLPNQSSLPGETSPQRAIGQPPLPPQNQFVGHISQHPHGARPYLGTERSVPIMPVRAAMPGLQGSGYHCLLFSSQPPLPGYNPPQRFSGQQFPPQYGGQRFQRRYDRTPYLRALREHALNIANEFPLPEEYQLDDGQPIPLQNVTEPIQNPYGTGMRGHVHALSIANERSRPPGENPPERGQPPEANVGPADNGALPDLEAIYDYTLNVANESRHLTMMKIGRRHKFSMKVNSEQHDNWLILALEEYFHLRIDVDVRTWGVVVYVSYIGPKCDAKNFTYEVTVDGQHNQRKLVYARTTHSDVESSSLNVSRQDCFHLTLDQALNFIRFKNRHCDADRFLDFNVEIRKVEQPATQRDESDS